MAFTADGTSADSKALMVEKTIHINAYKQNTAAHQSIKNYLGRKTHINPNSVRRTPNALILTKTRG